MLKKKRRKRAKLQGLLVIVSFFIHQESNEMTGHRVIFFCPPLKRISFLKERQEETEGLFYCPPSTGAIS